MKNGRTEGGTLISQVHQVSHHRADGHHQHGRNSDHIDLPYDLFLRRKKKQPETCEFVQTRISAWFKKDFKHDPEFDDACVLDDFCSMLELHLMIYLYFY